MIIYREPWRFLEALYKAIYIYIYLNVEKLGDHWRILGGTIWLGGPLEGLRRTLGGTIYRKLDNSCISYIHP